MSSSPKRVWFITGSSTGFGRILAEEVLKAGGSVAATARKPEQVADLERDYAGRAKAIALDVTDKSQVESAVATAIAKFGRIDVLVNNAGYGLFGAIEEASEDEIAREYDTNLFGALHVTRAVLPQMRKQRSGHILQLSSIGGQLANPGGGYYSSTKFALEGFSEGLAGEAAHLGIRVTIVEPGPFRTDFAGRSVVLTKRRIDDYKPATDKMFAYLENADGKQAGDPLRAVHALMDVVEHENPPLRLLLGKVALERFRDKLVRARADSDAWEQVTLSADFPENK